jgi:hypothetical protein
MAIPGVARIGAAALGGIGGALSQSEKARQYLGNYKDFVLGSYKDWGQNLGRAKEQVGGALGQVGDALFPTPVGASGQLIESDNPLLRSQGQANLNRSDVSGALFPSSMNEGGRSVTYMPPPNSSGVLGEIGGMLNDYAQNRMEEDMLREQASPSGDGNWNTYRQHLERLRMR